MTNPVEAVFRPIDRWQQRNRYARFAFGVIKKSGDDRGGMLAGMITFYGFLSVFPLLLVAFTVLGFVAGSPHSHLYTKVQTSILSEFPVVGDQLKTGNGLHGSGLALAAGLLGLLWGALGVTQAIQFAANEVWDVPLKDRPAFLSRLLRGVGVFGAFGLGVLATTALSVLGTVVGGSLAVGAIGLATALALNVGLFLALYRLVGPREADGRPVRWADLLPGAVLAGVGWQILQVVGQSLVRHNLRHSEPLYGQFAVVLGLISFLGLAAQLFVYAAEVNVVRFKDLLPRSLVQPPLLEADRAALTLRARQEERRPEERVEVRWADVDRA